MTEDSTIKQRRKRLEQSLQGYPFPKFERLKDKNWPGFEQELSYAYNYANYTYEHDQLKGFVQEFLDKAVKLNPEFWGKFNISRVPSWEFMFHGITAWLHLKEVPLAESTFDRMRDHIIKCDQKYKVETKRVVRDMKAVRTGRLIEELEGLLDDAVMGKHVAKPADIVAGAGLVDAEKVRLHFLAQIEEITNPANAEYFTNEKNNKIHLVVLGVIVKALEKVASEKPVRKARVMKPRKINPTKMVKKLKYLKEDKETGVVSISPETIVGAEVLWVYNAKSRKLGRYVAKDGLKLLIKGSTLQNFDEEYSVSKKLRKPKETLSELNNAGKVAQRHILDNIRAVASPLNGRINSTTILVKVF